MMLKILKLIIIAAVLGAAILISTTFRRSYESGRNSEPEISTSISILSPETSQKISTTSVNIIKAVSRKPVLKTSESVTINPVKNKVYEEIKEDLEALSKDPNFDPKSEELRLLRVERARLLQKAKPIFSILSIAAITG